MNTGINIINKILLIPLCQSMIKLLLSLIFRFRMVLNLINFMIMTQASFVQYDLSLCVCA